MNYVYYIDRDRCKGCGLCVAVCPKKVLEISDEVNTKGYFPVYQAHPEDCVFCATCCIMCPDVALTITEAFEEMAQ
ncbi:MAG: 4Fe-4S dicluster domain-containing protein [Deltaproteobacteria bacterium]|nr:4Fe-4S dicluster domain-containing protein [Deltaproteobacteria bacterium]MBW2076091.1 4Fe-4S dicluster domain-containing protein [Deltaproteobacteria bacterium]MBW2311615.1 4Fe-4S dicluster domain-containing protein [Deltaproteobacteria bacterium]